MDPFDIPIEPIRPPHIEVDPSLRTITRGVPKRAAIDAPVPEVHATTQEHLDNFKRNAVTHVVIQVTISRQIQIFKYIGYQYDWNVPSPFWDFLGRIAAKAIFNDQVHLNELNFVTIGRRKAAGVSGLEGLPPLSVIEVNFKKPQPGQPIEVAWVPARALFTAKIRQWNERAGKPLDHHIPKKLEAEKTGPDVGEAA
ncbi:hypothetical protein C8A01DRAFT_45492 [Parachaetomium inaequale]|uniref:Uncharacterized protein n=1 Tax=Parachaetomium inaequale TaxID=2588326 RepID=A0AAN6PM17_9PEZI|nr:hypothetical protein C8A01DRAFT_45492 [Parachaetomium inaequale]